MWFCTSHRGWARHARFIIGSLLTVWMVLSLALMPSVSAHAAERLSTLAPLGDPQELETFLDGVLAKQLADHHIPGAEDLRPTFERWYPTMPSTDVSAALAA